LNKNNVDIIILGGGFSASILAIQLLRKQPDLKLLILEKDAEFKQKVGESTSDITALFLRRFDIDNIMGSHVQKTGLRFLFNEKKSEKVADQTEFSSPTYDGPNNGFQINRKKFDEQLLEKAISLGAEVFRPVEVLNLRHEDFNNEISFKHRNEQMEFKSKWLVDATGRARMMHKKLYWKDVDIPLHTGAVYAHFNNVQPKENWKIAPNQYWEENAVGDSSLSTIHFMREKSWWWLIKIDDTTTSIGFVFEQGAPGSDDPIKWFKEQLNADPQLASIVKNATHSEPIAIDGVAYMSEKLYDKGIALMGDSGCFIDPLVSPGMELICQQSIWLTELLSADIKTGKFQKKKWCKYERLFKRAYMHRMEIYHHGYRYMKSYDLSTNWLQLGLLAYFGIFVFMAFVFPKRLKRPFTIPVIGRFGFNYMIWRLNRIQKRRVKQKRTSKTKPNEVTYSSFYYPKGIFFFTIPMRMFFKWLGRYISLEAREFAYLFKRSSN
jgi:flavin-dependent dehydrogenase